jgi:hypothetical protein
MIKNLNLQEKNLSFSSRIFRLSHISQIVREVGMNLQGSPCVPFSWSFGPIPWSSSEGFLDTFTPRVWKIRYLPLSFFSEYVSEVKMFHRRFFQNLATAKKLQQGRTPYTTMPTRVIASSLQKGLVILYSERPVRVFIVPMGSFSTESEFEKLRWTFNSPGTHRGEVLRIDTMNPRPQGILGSLNPTEEALRKGRNTLKRVTGEKLKSFFQFLERTLIE